MIQPSQDTMLLIWRDSPQLLRLCNFCILSTATFPIHSNFALFCIVTLL